MCEAATDPPRWRRFLFRRASVEGVDERPPSMGGRSRHLSEDELLDVDLRLALLRVEHELRRIGGGPTRRGTTDVAGQITVIDRHGKRSAVVAVWRSPNPDITHRFGGGFARRRTPVSPPCRDNARHLALEACKHVHMRRTLPSDCRPPDEE